MILLRLTGGLGNQMFQFAFAKAISLKKNVELKIDTSLLGESDVENLIVRHFDLDVFGIQNRYLLANTKEIEKFNGKKDPSIGQRIKYKIRRSIYPNRLVFQEGNKVKEAYLHLPGKELCIVGRWQSEVFFKEYMESIRTEFSLKDFQANAYSKGVSVAIQAKNSVVIHVRRRDYITHPVYCKTIGALDKSYYIEAINYFEEKNRGYWNYYFISDDIEWCKKNFSNIEGAKFVEQEKNKLGYLSDFWLLSLAGNIIISNSTFAWWGAWLGEQNSNLIIAPSQWTRDPKESPEKIIPERWTKIENEFEPLL